MPPPQIHSNARVDTTAHTRRCIARAGMAASSRWRGCRAGRAFNGGGGAWSLWCTVAKVSQHVCGRALSTWCRGAGWSSSRCAHHCSKKTSAHAKAAGQATAARGPGQQRGCTLFAHVCCIARAKIDNWKGCCRSRWSPCDVICCRCPRAAGPRLLCSDCSCARERHHLASASRRCVEKGSPHGVVAAFCEGVVPTELGARWFRPQTMCVPHCSSRCSDTQKVCGRTRRCLFALAYLGLSWVCWAP